MNKKNGQCEVPPTSVYWVIEEITNRTSDDTWYPHPCLPEFWSLGEAKSAIYAERASDSVYSYRLVEMTRRVVII